MRLIKGGRIIDPKTERDFIGDVLIQGDKIVKIAPQITVDCPVEVVDATGLVVAPGLVDIHVHFREPGQTHKEDIQTGVAAAVAGGFTTVVMMANTTPIISDVETLTTVLEIADKQQIHVKSLASVTQQFNGKTLTDFQALLQAGAVGFSDDGVPLEDSRVLKDALTSAAKYNAVISVHEEDPRLNGVAGLNETVAQNHFQIIGASGVAEYSMIARDVMIAYASGAKLHIQHLSKAESVKVVALAQSLGAKVSAEATPQHFSITEEAVLTHGANAKMNPPLRLESDRQAIIEGLKSGVISVIATDHAPHHVSEKSVSDITKAPSGMIGLETALSLGLTHLVSAGHLTVMELLRLMTINPATLYGFDAGYLSENGPADIVIFDPNRTRVITESFYSKSQNSPFVNQTVKGVVTHTICAGNLVYQQV